MRRAVYLGIVSGLCVAWTLLMIVAAGWAKDHPVAGVFPIVLLVMVPMAVAIYLIQSVYIMYTQPEWHFWPSVARCQLCQKRIYVWQNYERRDMKMKVMMTCTLPVQVWGSSLCHTACEGQPEGEVTASREVVTRSAADERFTDEEMKQPHVQQYLLDRVNREDAARAAEERRSAEMLAEAEQQVDREYPAKGWPVQKD